jgi:hypothetical protein
VRFWQLWLNLKIISLHLMLQKQWRLRELNFSCALGFLKIILEGEALQTVQALEKVGVIGAFMAILSRRHGGF